MKKTSKVLAALFPTTRELDINTWIQMIDARVEESIEPLLGKFTLQTLGSLPVSGPTGQLGESMHKVSDDAPEFSPEGYSESTQGLFEFALGGPPWEHAYGLNRKAEWVIVDIKSEDRGTRQHLLGSRGGEPTYKDQTYYEATEVVVSASTPLEICNRFWETPEKGCESLYSMLDRAVLDWHSQAGRSFRRTSRLVEQIEFEQAALDLITRERK